MAVTSLWHIKGSLKALIEYVENPEKTLPQDDLDFWNVVHYIQRQDKTDEPFITGINCHKAIALEQMIETKKQYDKLDKYIAWHGYQSFAIGETTPEEAHTIGVELAQQMWGGRFQVVVTTHLDKEHIHNHFLVNSVSFLDGKKYVYSKSEIQRLRDTSDRLCREHHLSVIIHPHKAPSRPVWLDEKSGKPTRYNVYREDVEAAFRGSQTVEQAERYLRQLGYITDFTGKHWKIRLPQYKHATRLDTLNPAWTPDYLRWILDTDAPVRAVIIRPRELPYALHEAYTPHRKTSYIYRLYLYYCYQLGILPRHTDYRPTSPFLREELRKKDAITQQVTYMAEHDIDTVEDLQWERERLESRIYSYKEAKSDLQKIAKKNKDSEQLPEIKADIVSYSAEIRDLRRQLKLLDDIEARSQHIQETLDRVHDTELAIQEQNKHTRHERSFER